MPTRGRPDQQDRSPVTSVSEILCLRRKGPPGQAAIVVELRLLLLLLPLDDLLVITREFEVPPEFRLPGVVSENGK